MHSLLLTLRVSTSRRSEETQPDTKIAQWSGELAAVSQLPFLLLLESLPLAIIYPPLQLLRKGVTFSRFNGLHINGCLMAGLTREASI